MRNNNSDSKHLPTPDERALYIHGSIRGIQKIIGECMAKYEENGDLSALRLAFDCHVQLIEILKQVKEQYSYGHEYDYGK